MIMTFYRLMYEASFSAISASPLDYIISSPPQIYEHRQQLIRALSRTQFQVQSEDYKVWVVQIVLSAKVLIHQLGWVVLEAKWLPLKLSNERPPLDCSLVDFYVTRNLMSIESLTSLYSSETLSIACGQMTLKGEVLNSMSSLYRYWLPFYARLIWSWALFHFLAWFFIHSRKLLILKRGHWVIKENVRLINLPRIDRFLFF